MEESADDADTSVLFLDMQVSLAPTLVRPSVGKSLRFQHLRPHKASRRHCSGRYCGWHAQCTALGARNKWIICSFEFTLFWRKFMNKVKYAFCVLLGWNLCVCYFLGISHVWHYWLMRRRHAKAGHPSKPMPYNSCLLHFGDGTSDYTLSWIKAPEVMYFDPILKSDVTVDNLIICIAI